MRYILNRRRNPPYNCPHCRQALVLVVSQWPNILHEYHLFLCLQFECIPSLALLRICIVPSLRYWCSVTDTSSKSSPSKHDVKYEMRCKMCRAKSECGGEKLSGKYNCAFIPLKPVFTTIEFNSLTKAFMLRCTILGIEFIANEKAKWRNVKLPVHVFWVVPKQKFQLHHNDPTRRRSATQ